MAAAVVAICFYGIDFFLSSLPFSIWLPQSNYKEKERRKAFRLFPLLSKRRSLARVAIDWKICLYSINSSSSSLHNNWSCTTRPSFILLYYILCHSRLLRSVVNVQSMKSGSIRERESNCVCDGRMLNDNSETQTVTHTHSHTHTFTCHRCRADLFSVYVGGNSRSLSLSPSPIKCGRRNCFAVRGD